MLCTLRNLRIVDADGQRAGDVVVAEGKIIAVGENLPAQGQEIDCGQRTLMPAFVDLHAHFRDPGLCHKEDVHTGCRAAVHGGYTTVNLMANTKPVCSTPEIVGYVRDKAAELDICDVYQTVSITRDFGGEDLSHLDHLEESVRWLSDDGFGVKDTGAMLRAMEKAKEMGVGVMLHEEDPALTKIDMYLAEDLMTFRDVKLALLTGCKTHFCHVSTVDSMNYIREGKRQGGKITCEVTPHHIMLNDRSGGNVAPPLRGEKHRQYLIECIKEGLVDAIATDHAPHTAEEKAQGVNGFTGLDIAFSTCYTALVREGHIDLPKLSWLMSESPAQLLGLHKGKIQPGMPADLVLVDLDAAYTVTEECMHSKGKSTPLMGQTLYGTVCMTMKEGKIVYGQAD